MKKLILFFGALLYALPSFGQSVGPITISSSQCATIGTLGQATIGIQVVGSFTGTLQPQGTIQGQPAFNLTVVPANSSTAQGTITATGGYSASVAGLSTFQLCGNTVSVGAALVYLNASQAQLGNGSSGGSAPALTAGGFAFPSTGATPPAGTINADTCPAGDPVVGWTQLASGNWQTQASIDETTLHGGAAGRLNLGCWGLDFNDSGIAPIAGNNNWINFYHTWGNGGVQTAGTNGAAVSIFTISNGTQTDFGGAGQLVNLYAENRMTGDPTIPTGPEPAISVIRATYSDERTGATHTLSGGSGGLGPISASFEIHTNGSYGSCAQGGCANGVSSVITTGATPVATGSHGSDLTASFFARRDYGGSTATNILWAGYIATSVGTRFATGNYGYYSQNFGTNAADWNYFGEGVNSAGAAAGFNGWTGPSSFGTAVHAASTYQVDILGATKMKAGAGVSQLCLFGSTSGSACQTTAAAAGTTVATWPTGLTGTVLLDQVNTAGTSVGLGTLTQVGNSVLSAQTTSLGPTTLVTVGASTASYLVIVDVECKTAVATATVAVTINYTDASNTAQSIAPSAAACTALGVSSFALINSPIRAKNGTTITYSTTAANSPNYDISAQVYQRSTN